MALLAAMPSVPLFLDSTALAMTHALEDPFRNHQDSGTDGKILVIVQLSGGNDGLNTVVPFADDDYHRSRPSLAKRAGDVLKLNDHIGLNAELASLKSLYDNGEMSIIQGVGYPNPNRSHFRSMDIWHTAEPDNERLTSGWLGRYFDAQCSGVDPKNPSAADSDKSMIGVAIGENQPLAMRGERILPVSFERAEQFRYRGSDEDAFEQLAGTGPSANGPSTSDAASNATPGTASPGSSPVATAQARARASRRGPAQVAPSAEDQLSFLSRTTLDAVANSDRIIRATGDHTPVGEYPRGDFGAGLRTVAAMIAGQMPTRVYYVSLGGFDTHANQAGRHDQLMATFAQGIDAFLKDMKAQGNADRVMVMTFSEFGRRVAQNASGGTDHGAAAPMFLFGSRLRSGIMGQHPSLTDLDSGDLKFNLDFRSIYASLLEHWLDVPSKPILGKQFDTTKIVRG